MGARNHQFCRGIYRRYIDREYLWAISTPLFLVEGKASRVLVDRWITFHDVQNPANRRCTGHATMSTERGNYGLITVHAPFLLSDQTKNPLAIFVWKPWVTVQRWKRKMCSMEFYQKILYLRVTHRAFIALQKFYSDHCLKYFCEFPNNISFSFLLQKKQTHTVCNNRPNIVDLSYRGQTAKQAR